VSTKTDYDFVGNRLRRNEANRHGNEK